MERLSGTGLAKRGLKLTSGSRVAVVGGGPAGTFFTLYLLRYARERLLDVSVTVYEPKRFIEGGPKACNRSAGILSSSFLRDLRDLRLELPDKVVQTYITRYELHSPVTTVPLANPDPDIIPVVVFRGGGPLRRHDVVPESFDGHLLRLVELEGAMVVRKRVDEVIVRPRPVVVIDGSKEEHDLVVLAGGVNSALPRVSGSTYLPPGTCIMAQDELYAGEDVVARTLGTTVHIFFLPGSDFVFGSLVPKGAYINVSLLGRDCEPPPLDEFLEHELVKKVLDFPYERCCGCRGKAAMSLATGPVDDGFVAIGDACVSRLYKDGIGSALRTARQAARTALFHGISARDFQGSYLPLCRAIERDNRYGLLLFDVHKRAKNSVSFLKAQARVVSAEQGSIGRRKPFSRIIWGMFTGSYAYAQIMLMAVNPLSLLRLLGAVVWEKAGLPSRRHPRTGEAGDGR